MANYKGAVIGVNGIGKWHGQMMRDTGGIDVVAVCDVNPAMREVAAKEFPSASFHTDLAEMLAAAKPDLVAIATPHHLHAPLSIQCLQAGANVVVEKPMATTYADCRAMIDAATKAGRFLTVFHNRRLDPWFLAAKACIDDGMIGKLVEMNIGIGYFNKSSTWRGVKACSGGVMFDWGAHLVDYAQHFDPSPITAVGGWLYRSTTTKPEQNEDHGALRIYFESGATAAITVSEIWPERPHRYRIIGERGSIVDTWNFAQDGTMKLHTKTSGGDLVTADVNYRKSDAQAYYTNILKALKGECEPAVSAESAARVINVLTTAERSSNAGGAPLPLA